MIDNDIIKALECCRKAPLRECKKCPYYEEAWCDVFLKRDVLDLTKRQKAEIERLTAQRDKAVEDFTEFAQIAFDNPFACKHCAHYVEDSGGCLWKLDHENDKEGCLGRHFEYREKPGENK